MTGQATIDKLIINSPYEEPKEHWHYDRDTRLFSRKAGRRQAGYVIASESSKAFDDLGIFIPIPLPNKIRPRVKAWREAGYPGVTSITRRLLEYWTDPEEYEVRRFFFCQLEAIETLIWLVEAPAADKVGIDIPSDGGDFQRICCKMATGAGKTIVMAMAIAWQILNKVTYPKATWCSKNVLVIAPGLTVRNRLAVLGTTAEGNYYEAFHIVPPGLMEKLRQGRVMVKNWHAFGWDTKEQVAKRRSVDKRGAKSDEAYIREILGEMARSRDLLVINDEAHHAWRVPAESKVKGVKKEELEEATKWVGALDRIHRTRGILKCYDFSATPFAPSGKKSSEEALFDWIVSDFGLNDAIESGLVKTPRVVIRDDARLDTKTYKSRLYHIYNDPEVKDNLSRKAEIQEPLPDLVLNAFYLLGFDWRDTLQKWKQAMLPVPPVMITVCNRTETAARIRYAFEQKKVHIDELCDPDGLLHIDSRVLDEAEAQDEPEALKEPAETDDTDEDNAPRKKLGKKEFAESLRQRVDTVGRPGMPGERVQNVISVGMLSEGWDAKTVTHIMGLRAFSSQLLCEQVVGRGLRRTSYEVKSDKFEAEYVNIFGIPFTFLPHESTEDTVREPGSPKVAIEPDPDKNGYEIKWPNVLRVDHVLRPTLSLDWPRVKPLLLDASQTARLAELAPIIDGKPDVRKIASIDLEKLAVEFRMQRIIFEAARDVYVQMQKGWRGDKTYLLAQVIHLVEQFIRSDRIQIEPPLFGQDELSRRLIITLNMSRVVHHIWEAIRFENAEKLELVFDTTNTIRSTKDMTTWYTGKPWEHTAKSHINKCVLDSTWEGSDMFALDHHPAVDAWVKNDHLGFEILYIHRGIVRKYRPDFIVRLVNGKMLVIETKGQETELDRTKRQFLQEWIEAVNAHGGFGTWTSAITKKPGEIAAVIQAQASR